MIGTVVFYGLAVFVVWLGAAEAWQYRNAQDDPEDIAYPRRRLIRRLAIAGVTLAILAAVRFAPDISPWGELAWYGGCFVGAMIIILLALRDLHETSLAVLREHARLKRSAEEQIEETAETLRTRKRRK